MSVQTVRDAWDFYKNSILSSCNSKKSTLISDESRWKCHINPLLGNKRIDMLTKADYLLLRKSIENKMLSPQTVHHVISLLRRILNASVEWEVYNGKDFPNFQKIFPKFDNMRQRFLSHEEALKLISFLEPYEEWHDIAMLSLNTGLRLGEIFKISISDVNFYERLLTVIDTKSRKNRVIPLNCAAFSILSKKNKIKQYRYFSF